MNENTYLELKMLEVYYLSWVGSNTVRSHGYKVIFIPLIFALLKKIKISLFKTY